MRIRLLLVCLCALVPLLLWGALPLVSSGESLNDVQQKIQRKQAQIGRKKGTERVLTGDISAYSARIGRLQGHISSLRRQEAGIQSDLDAKRAQLSRVQAQLRDERARLTRLRARLVVTRRALADRLVELYESDRPDLVTVVLDAKGFADLLERGEFLRRISDADRTIVETVKRAKADATQATQRLSALERQQRQVAAAILQRRDAVDHVRTQLVSTRDGYARARDGKRRLLARVRSQRENLEGDLTALRSEERKIQARLAAAAGSPTLPAGPIRQGGGGLIWPVNGPITSPFCESRAWESCHPGIDIGVPSGTPIRAAAAGTVALEQPEAASGGYGNFTCIQHTASMSTCYAHQERFAVSVGEHVAQGQIIGYSDCTGRCYGPHLHFEVRINGQVTNPLNYL